MQNIFSVTLSFSNTPLEPYEWDKIIHISGIEVKRVTHKCLVDILLHECTIKSRERIILLSDGNTSLAIRLNKDGTINARSFLDYESDLKVIEYSKQLKPINLKYEKRTKKIEYSSELKEDIIIKKYILDSLDKCKNIDLLKYLYYMCFNSIKGFSKEKLIEFIKNNKSGKNGELYKILISA